MKGKKELTITEFAAMGGRARNEALTKEQRKAIAKKAAQKRWADEKRKKTAK